MSKSAEVAYKRLTGLLSERRDEPYNKVISWIRCRLRYSLLRSAIAAICDSRTSIGSVAKYRDSIVFASNECKL